MPEVAALLQELEAIEAHCAAEEWDAAEHRLADFDLAVRAIDWSKVDRGNALAVLDRQRQLAIRFISGREEAASVLRQMNQGHRARDSYRRESAE